jgi:hypothetical protein
MFAEQLMPDVARARERRAMFEAMLAAQAALAHDQAIVCITLATEGGEHGVAREAESGLRTLASTALPQFSALNTASGAAPGPTRVPEEAGRGAGRGMTPGSAGTVSASSQRRPAASEEFRWPEYHGAAYAGSRLAPPGAPLDHIQAAAASVFIEVASLFWDPAATRALTGCATDIAAADYDTLASSAAQRQWLASVLRDAQLDDDVRSAIARVQQGYVPNQGMHEYVQSMGFGAPELHLAIDLAYPAADLNPFADDRAMGMDGDCRYCAPFLASWKPRLTVPLVPAEELEAMRSDAEVVLEALCDVQAAVARVRDPRGPFFKAAEADGLAVAR